VQFQNLRAEFSHLFEESQLKEMDCAPFQIHLKDDAKPHAISVARNVPIAYRDALKRELLRMESMGIISRYDEPSAWCSPIVVVPKKNDDVRICIDFTRLNQNIQRQYHHSDTPFEIVSTIPSDELGYFCKFDCKSGYWQIPIAEQCRPLTAFITPFGRYVCNRAPFGISSISDVYNARMDDVVQNLHGIVRTVDDLMVYAPTPDILLQRTRALFDRCKLNNVTLNDSKTIMFAEKVEFSGYVISKTGFSICPDIILGITDFPTPTSLTELRSFFGLVNQLSQFSTNISRALEPLRPLLSTKNVFNWTSDHDAAFRKAKQLLTSPSSLVPFDPSRETRLSTDASRLNGLGFTLEQLVDDHWRLVTAGSRFISETESRYAMIELEALAVYWAMNKNKLYLLGLPSFELRIDHMPLIPILNKMSVYDIQNPRLQRLKAKLLPYSFKAVWVKGKEHFAADALSLVLLLVSRLLRTCIVNRALKLTCAPCSKTIL
jgi:hypothetical protein